MLAKSGNPEDKQGKEAISVKETIRVLAYFRDIPKQVKINNSIIQNLEDQHYNTLKSTQLDGMPKGKGGISNPVEQTILSVPEGVRETIESLQRENKKLEKLQREITEELLKLEYRERKIIYEFYIYEHNWEKIARGFYSVRQCKNIRNAALKKLGQIFRANTTINQILKND